MVVESKSNLEIHRDKNYVLVSLNPKIYPLDVVYSTCYVFMDRAYIVIDGDPAEEIIVELVPKEKGYDLEKLGREFNNELLNYAVYKVQAERNAGIRQAIVQRALLTAGSGLLITESEDEDKFEDPEGIAIPWEEKFGDKDGENSD